MVHSIPSISICNYYDIAQIFLSQLLFMVANRKLKNSATTFRQSSWHETDFVWVNRTQAFLIHPSLVFPRNQKQVQESRPCPMLFISKVRVLCGTQEPEGSGLLCIHISLYPSEFLVGTFHGSFWCLWCLFQSPTPDYPKGLCSPSESSIQSSSTWSLIKKPGAMSSFPTSLPLESFKLWTDLIWLCFLKGYSSYYAENDL